MDGSKNAPINHPRRVRRRRRRAGNPVPLATLLLVALAACAVIILGVPDTRYAPEGADTWLALSPPATSEAGPAGMPSTAGPSASADSSNLLRILMEPFLDQARKDRADRAKSDPDYIQRIDPALNSDRVNLLLFGYGETYEPPAGDKMVIGSYTVVSYDLRSEKADLISLTHDIRAPEIERLLQSRGGKPPAVKIDEAYAVGGYSLMRAALEDATGLSIDFQIVFKDVALQALVDEVLGTVQIDVPTDFQVWSFYLDGKKYPEAYFSKGLQRMNGTQVMQFIKSIEGTYDSSLERNRRKHLAFQAILSGLNERCDDYAMWLRLVKFSVDQMRSGTVTYDFDAQQIAFEELKGGISSLGSLAREDSSCGFGASTINRTLYVVDPAHGDGGVQWATANAAINPITRKDIQAGVYPDGGGGYEVPITSNPNGDLVTGYWPSVRSLIKTTLLKGQ